MIGLLSWLNGCQPTVEYPCELPADGIPRYWTVVEPAAAPLYVLTTETGERIENDFAGEVVTCAGDEELNLWWIQMSDQQRVGTEPFYAGPGLTLFPAESLFTEEPADHSLSLWIDDEDDSGSLAACDTDQFALVPDPRGTLEDGFSIRSLGSVIDARREGDCAPFGGEINLTFGGSYGYPRGEYL